MGAPLNNGGGTPGVDYVATAVDSEVLNTTGPHDFDVTSVMQLWADGADNYGLYIRQLDSNGAWIHADDAATLSNRPLLTVDFSAPPTAAIPEPSTIAIWALGLLGLGWFGWRRRGCQFALRRRDSCDPRTRCFGP